MSVHSNCLRLLLLGIVSLGGCHVVGVIADKVAGDRPVPATHTPDPLKPLLVIAENYRDPSSNGSDAERVQALVGDRLAEHQVAPIVSDDAVRTVRDRSPQAFRKMTVVEIAKAVGAQQVLYIDITGIGVGAQVGSDSLKGVAGANVKLIDATTGAVLFPADLDAGATVGFESPLRRASSTATPDRVRIETLVGLSDRIARLFHSYRPSDLERLGDGED